MPFTQRIIQPKFHALEPFLRAAALVVCALMVLVFQVDSTIWAADSAVESQSSVPLSAPAAAPERFTDRMIPRSIRTPLSSMLNTRSNKEEVPELPIIYNELPGFGASRGESPKSPPPPVSLSPDTYWGGALVDSRRSDRSVPAVYIEGLGYLPLDHPAIGPYLGADESNPATNPNIVMIPESRLATSGTQQLSGTGSRMLDVSGSTTISYPRRENLEPIIVSAQNGWSKQSEEFDIYFLHGDCSIRQGKNCVQAPQAVVWVDRPKPGSSEPKEITVYLESGSSDTPLLLEIDPENVDAHIIDKKWFGRFETHTTIQTLIMNPDLPQQREPAIYHRALSAMSPDYSVIRQAQYVQEQVESPQTVQSTPARFRRITFNSRGDNLMHIRFDPFPNNPDRGILVVTKGLNLIVEGINAQDMPLSDVIDISADHAVIWASNPSKLSQSQDLKEDSANDFEVYLEGNIIFRDGERTIKAHRMYYDAKNRIAYVLDASLSTIMPGPNGDTSAIRVKAEVLQQLGDGLFTAKNSLVTTSMLGEPSYSLRSRHITLSERYDSSGAASSSKKTHVLVAENNYVAARQFPVFYWPWMAADLKDPTFYIKKVDLGHGTNFGTSVRTTWNPFQLLNIRNRPDWLDGEVDLDWLEKRGFAHGGTFTYNPNSFCTCEGPVRGKIRYWGLYDNGSDGDNLGFPRTNVPFPNKYRYRFIWQHEQQLQSLWKINSPLTLSASVGKVSDRNVVNTFFADEWRTGDNDTTRIGLKNQDGNTSLSLFAEYALDPFYTSSNWLPRLDHYLTGQSLLNDYLTWYGHTRVGYMNYHATDAPPQNGGGNLTPDIYFDYLPWETTGDGSGIVRTSGEVFSTRHELDLPLSLGPFRVVPYVLGEFSHWGKDRNYNDVQRWYGQTGVKVNLPFWKINPNYSNRMWYVNGLAHKVDLDAEFFHARASQNVDGLIMTDAMDSWSIEDARRRAAILQFEGKPVPKMFDPRYYAIRRGYAGNVNASNMELADNMTFARFGFTNRWQTKRGPAGRRHIIDWITFGAHFNYYPDAEQNDGQSVGMIDYNFLWHVGDRFSLFSNGMYEKGQDWTTLGGVWQRPDRGHLSVKYDRFKGQIDQNYLTLGVGYAMNEKYAVQYTTSFEIKKKWESSGHNFMFTRTGESFRLLLGVTYSQSREEWSFSFGIEPIFMRGIMNKFNNAMGNSY